MRTDFRAYRLPALQTSGRTDFQPYRLPAPTGLWLEPSIGRADASLPKCPPLFEILVSEKTGIHFQWRLPAVLRSFIPLVRRNEPKISNNRGLFGRETFGLASREGDHESRMRMDPAPPRLRSDVAAFHGVCPGSKLFVRRFHRALRRYRVPLARPRAKGTRYRRHGHRSRHAAGP